jgi:hypothetical protein
VTLKDPAGNPLGSLFSHLTALYLPIWLGMHILAFISPLWLHTKLEVPDVLDQVALPILAAYGLTRKQQNGNVAQALADIADPSKDEQAKPPGEPKG